MAKKQPVPLETNAEVVDDLHATTEEEGVTYEDVTGKDDLPPGVADPSKDEDDDAPVKQPAKKTAKPAAAKAEGSEEEVPEELKGKTPAQLAKMYREAQQVIGRQGTELGELRRVADTYIKHTLTKSAPAAQSKTDAAPVKEPDAVDFFTNPQKAIAEAVANHPAIKALEGTTKDVAAREMTRQRTEAAAEFHRRHPDAGEIMQDEGFRAWVTKSPVRQAMIVRANRHYDLMAGDEIFSTWKELQAARNPKSEAEGADKAQQAKPNQTVKTPAGKEAARVPTGGNASPRQAANKEGKIYRRADVIRLMETDPERYQMMADEITKAYIEGHVR